MSQPVPSQFYDPGGRIVFVDWMKAIAILVVIFIHSQRWGIGGSGIHALGVMTRFAVPTFFFVSGLLLSSPEPIPAAGIARRLLRIVPPYVVASLVAFLFGRIVLGERLAPGEMGFRLLVGAASGIYYFIPILAGVIVVAILLSGHRRILTVLGTSLIVATLFVESGYLLLHDYGTRGWFFWELRNPLRWWGYFFAGWLLRPACVCVPALPRYVRLGLGLAALLLPATACFYTLLAGEMTPGVLPGTLVLLNNYGAILAMLALGSLAPEYRLVHWLSEATYPLYLYHFFVTQLVLQAPISDLAAIPAAFVVGSVMTSLFLVLARRALGAMAPVVLG